MTTKFKSQGCYIIKIIYWNASRSGFPPFLIPALRNIGIFHYKKAKLWNICNRVYIYFIEIFDLAIKNKFKIVHRISATNLSLKSKLGKMGRNPAWSSILISSYTLDLPIYTKFVIFWLLFPHISQSVL